MLKKLILLLCFVPGVLFACAQQLPPKSGTLVTDFTNTLSPSEKQQLESKLVAFSDTSSTQIAVVMLKSVGDYDINDYAQKLGRAWGVGQKGKNNGIVILVAMGDRKVSIQTGYGVEGALPDIITHQIIERDIKPNFKAGNYFAGLDAGTDDVIKYVRGEYKADAKPRNGEGGGGGSIAILIIIVVVILIFIFRNRGGGGQIIDSRGGASPFWWFLAGSMLGRGSGGGGWGGFSGGGGGDSGGFGGFGGGDFGGGGSSGSW
jgi:uncharacterized protein